MKQIFFIITIAFCFIFIQKQTYAQLNIDNTSMTPNQLVQNVLIGSGVTVSNINYSGNIPNSIGRFSTGNNPTNLGLSSGIILSTGNVLDAPGPNISGSTSGLNGTGSDPDLSSLVSATIYDAAVLTFSFVPVCNTLKFRYVFGSEEYPEFVGTMFNDVFGFFLSGPGINGPYSNGAINIALIPGTTLPVTINNVNDGSYSQYYVNNANGASIEYDGFTTVFTAWAVVTPNQTYNIKIAIGDVGDSSYDSAVFLEEYSFSSGTISVNHNYSTNNDTVAYRGCSQAIVNFYSPLVVTTNTDFCYQILGTAVNGVDYTWIDTCVTILQGSQSAQLIIDPIHLGYNTGDKTVQLVLQVSACQGQVFTDTITIYIRDYVPMTLSMPGDTICLGGSTTLHSFVTNGLAPYSFLWSGGEQTTSIQLAPNTPGEFTYILTVTDACTPHINTVVDSVLLVVYPNPTSTFDASTDTICLNEVLTLTYTGNATTNAIYNWIHMGATIVSGSGQGPIQLEFSQAGLYSLSLQVEENGCLSDITYKTITVLPAPNVVIDSDIIQGCAPITVNFQDLTNDAVSWVWSFNGASPATSSQQNPDNIYYNNAGIYDVTLQVVNSYGCEQITTFSNYITVHPNPIADFVFTPTVGTPGLPINFTSPNQGNIITSWYWDYGDSNTGNGSNPTHAYGSNGSYTIWLVVETVHGCTDSINKEIIIIDIVIPNVFTPNNDGINDYFVIDGIELIDDCELVIFNRWGKKVFESTNYKNNWDGNGSADGVYYYIFTLPQNIAKPYNGTVTIIR